MVTATLSTFTHRWNYDGSYDSICLLCNRTIATGRKEWELAEGEENHELEGCMPIRSDERGLASVFQMGSKVQNVNPASVSLLHG
jgi:hypothetical protein